MNNSTSANSTSGEESNGRLLNLYNNKRNDNNGIPTLKRSISRNTLLSSNSVPPTRPLFNNNNSNSHHKSLPIEAQQQRVLTVENAVFPEHQQPLFPSESTITKRSSSTPVMVTSTAMFRISWLK
jgi:hypothetical protein